MKVRMLYTKMGSPDGFRVNRYVKGLIYELPHTLAVSFVKAGAAEQVEPTFYQQQAV